jgi:hypothetical protein
MRSVVCKTCDPPCTVQVPDDWDIDVNNYICTVCQARALKRIERATMVSEKGTRRLGHGESLAGCSKGVR